MLSSILSPFYQLSNTWGFVKQKAEECIFGKKFTEATKSDYNQYWFNRPYLPNGIKERVTPYLLPYDHPVREDLDRLYTQSIATLSKCSDNDKIIASRTVRVIFHPDLLKKGFIIKEPQRQECSFGLNSKAGYRFRYTKPLRRVQGHTTGCDLINKRKFSKIKVTQNWLYPLPNLSSLGASIAYLAAKPFRVALKALSIHCPKWLKYGDKIFTDRFVIIEEHIDIVRSKNNVYKILPSISEKVREEWREVFEAVGFNDAGPQNWLLDSDHKITLFDIDEYSQKSEKNKNKGANGMSDLFP